MPPKGTKSAIVLLTNVGSSSLEQNSMEDEPFLDKSKFIMKLLVEKKLFLQPTDEIGIITIGDETDNPYDIENVKLYADNLLVPNWEIIKYIKCLKFTNNDCNWIEGLHVALSYIEKEVIEPNCTVFLVIIHNFKEDAESINSYDPDPIADQLRSCYNVKLLFVGEKSLEEFTSNPNPSEAFVVSLLDKTEAQYEEMSAFIEQRRFYMLPEKNPMPWKFELEFSNFSIPCAEFVMVAESSDIPSWQLSDADSKNKLSNFDDLEELISDKSQVVKQTVILDHHRNEVSEDNIINGYEFGGKYIPFSDEDQTEITFDGTEKGMMVHSFVSQDEVGIKYWAGEGSRIIVSDSEEHQMLFYSLVRAMDKTKCAAIIRKVYSKNSIPRMGVLFPKLKDGKIYGLIHVELPFSEDIRYAEKSPLNVKEDQVDKAKLDALDGFIDSMTIKIEDTELDYFNPGMFPNVHRQYFFNAVADRALNPNGALLPVNDYIQKYLEVPEILKNRAKPYIEKLDEAFKECKNSQPVEAKKSPRVRKEEMEGNLAMEEGIVDASATDSDIRDKNFDDELFSTMSNATDLKSDELEDF